MNRSEPAPASKFATRLRSRALTLAAPLAAGALTVAMAALPVAPARGAEAGASYVATTESFANPERGFYRHTGDCDKSAFNATTLAGYRTNQHISLVMCIFYLSDFKASAISSAKIAFFAQQASAVRAAGLKMVVRFAYTKSKAGDDAPLSRVLAHIDQLTPTLRNNSDVIDVVQSGFVGAWGEGYYTQHFGDRGVLTAGDWANRKAVVSKLLNALPANRMVQLRTPTMKRTMYGTQTVSSANAYNGSGLSRLGHHNDCFLASSTDYGTYQDPAVEYPYLRADSTYVVTGGETCALNQPRSDCPTARNELAMFHYTYLNRDYHTGVLESWSSGGCLTEVEQRLGYRFTLTESLFPETVVRGGTMLAQLQLDNTGLATPHNPRPVWLVLRNTSTQATYRIKLDTDPRRWAAGLSTTITQTVVVPGAVPAGTYELLLSLPDPTVTLKARPEYAIRLANSGVWEPSTGLNRLLTTVTVRSQP